MKKIELKKIVTTALIAVTGLFALVAMKPMYKNFPALGTMSPPAVIDHSGNPNETVITVINNSTCETLSFDLGFKAQQGTGGLTNEAVFPNEVGPGTRTYSMSMFNGFFGAQINYALPYELAEGGIDINIGTLTKMNLKPGENLHWDNGTTSTEPCDCFNAVWDEVNKTITISDC